MPVRHENTAPRVFFHKQEYMLVNLYTGLAGENVSKPETTKGKDISALFDPKFRIGHSHTTGIFNNWHPMLGDICSPD